MTTLIATLPKSGTWYVSTVLAAYNAGEIESLIAGNVPIWRGEIGGGKYMVGHASGDNLREGYCLAGYTWLNDHLHDRPLNMFYCHREPVDHFVSYHRHLQTHLQKEERRLGELNIRDFIMDYALPSYINHFNSHRYSTKITYESLIENPEIHFAQIISAIDPDHNIDAKALLKAIELCSMDNLMGVEDKYGIALGRDQEVGNTHIRHGGGYEVADNLRDEIMKVIDRELVGYCGGEGNG